MRFLSFGVMIYMLMALIWWTILLSKNNNALYKNKLELLQLTQNQLYGVQAFDIVSTPEYTQITNHYSRSKYMILGEGMVFGISLILGMWFIQRAYVKEIENTRKQKNFLLSITHELKSPIASINLITETLLKRKISPEKTTDLHESILAESHRLEKLINNLLLTTRINNEYQYNFEAIDIPTIIDEVSKKMKLQFPAASINVGNMSTNATVSADRESMVSLFTNLVENAVKYSGENPVVHIEIKNSANDITISVSDHGKGIADKEKSKVTEQFYRIGNEDTRQTKGTGLGLYIVDKITKAHKGKLKIIDNQPSGTIFAISLPIKQS